MARAARAGAAVLSRAARAALVAMLCLAALVALPARAVLADSSVDAATQALRSHFVYVDPQAQARLTDAEVQILTDDIASAGTPIWLAVLPQSVLQDYGSPEAVLRAVADGVGQPGTYGVVIGPSTFHADSTGSHSVAAIADQAVKDNSTPFDVMAAFVTGVSDSFGRGTSASSRSSGGTTALALLVLVAAGGGALLIVSRRSRRRAEARAAQELAQVRPTFEEDVTLLGEEIDAVDLDVDAPETTDAMRARYQQGLDAYETARRALDRTTSMVDLPAVTAALEQGRYALTCLRALQAGEDEPARRPPCFVNPQHGPSTKDVPWAPAGGTVRDVPVCEDCARRMAHGEELDPRTVDVGGRRAPYWDAGPQYAGYAGGYFGGFGTMLPGILVGTLLGSSLGGGWGYGGAGYGGWAGDGMNDYGGDGGGLSGDIGGGDFGGGGGDFGGGGGDFGGGS